MAKLSDNDKTLRVYEDHAADYVAANDAEPSDGIKDWIDRALALIPEKGVVLELGSAYGRDAAYIKSKGYSIICTDAAKSFVSLLEQAGFEARILNALTDDFDFDQDMILANAVFLHFHRDELAQVLNKAYKSLKPNGVLAFTVKKGDGENWSSNYLNVPRYFCFWQLDAISEQVRAAGFKLRNVTERTSSHGAEWIEIIAQKQ
ncbi:MAG TPA: class I SAM-dependent methyltransferase [Candidatus Saccharimonadales bacterium]|nr:class I SAM-dependent methyltransferase [Candidatus Saccharimonadales bacterium]